MTTVNPVRSLPVALVQAAPVYLNLEASVDRAVTLVEQAAAGGAWLTAFPETWLPGYPVWLDHAPQAALWDHPPARALFAHMLSQCPTLADPHLDRLHQAAHRAGTHVVMGMQERDGATLRNTILYLHADGHTRRVHRKLVPTYTERLVWGPGDGSTLRALRTEQATVGALVCWEHWMPLARAAMHAQREHLHVAQWPGVTPLHQLASRHYAFEGQCYVLACGTVLSRGDLLDGFDSTEGADPAARVLLEAVPGDRETLLLQGQSAVIGPDSEYVLAPAPPGATLLQADLPMHRLAEGWMTLDTDGHYSRPDVFELHVDERPRANVRFVGDHGAATTRLSAPSTAEGPRPAADQASD